VTRSARGAAARVLALAVSLLPAGRRDWGDAMYADFAALERGAGRWRFALGCMRVALLLGAWRIAAYLAVEGIALVAAARSGITGAFLIEVIGLVLVVPPLVGWVGRPHGTLSLGAGRSARLVRYTGYVLIAACATVGIVYLAGEVAPQPQGSGAAALWTGVIVFVLAGYTVLMLAVTSAQGSVSARTLASGSGFGAVAGIAGFALLPFTQSYAVHEPWLASAYVAAIALVAVGAPAAPATVAAWRGDIE
jgi:hypothetical protein